MLEAMPKTIQQTVRLPASPDDLFDSYLDPARHAAITGHPVTIAAKPGSAFLAFDGQLSGRIVAVIPKRLIVQAWRSSQWAREDPDSILVLSFSGDRAYGQIDLVHVNVADHDVQGVTEGWEKYYWTPWRRFLGQP
jgi:activator of HSP90 ATPase